MENSWPATKESVEVETDVLIAPRIGLIGPDTGNAADPMLARELGYHTNPSASSAHVALGLAALGSASCPLSPARHRSPPGSSAVRPEGGQRGVERRILRVAR